MRLDRQLVGGSRGVLTCVVGARGSRVKLHSRRHIHFGAAEQLLGARFEAEVAAYAGVWRQKR